MRAACAYGVLYFLLVFAAGFLLAPLREWVLAPRIGTMWAELAEMPPMFAVMYVSAGWLAHRPALQNRNSRLLSAGALALSLMVLAELGVLFGLLHTSLEEYIGRRDPVSGTVYLLMLVLFALLPWLRRKA